MSDHKLYYGTENGKLMRYDTTTHAASLAANFALATGRSALLRPHSIYPGVIVAPSTP